MNEEVRLPIKTERDGNKITKVCVEDVYKIVNRVYDNMAKAFNKSEEALDSIHKEVDGWEGELIIGTGVSQPCMTDAFDEEIGNNIAFMKAKLNANMKKRNLLVGIYNNFSKLLSEIDEEIFKVEDLIEFDLRGIKLHNPDYLINDNINAELAKTAYERLNTRSNKVQNKFNELIKNEV